MGLFQGGTCALCGNKTGIVSLTTRDRQEVCIDCMMKKQIPSKYQKYIEELWTLDEMLHYPDYDARRKELCRVFPEDYYNLENPFGNLYVDNEHEMFAVVNGFGGNLETEEADVFEFANVDYLEFKFVPETYKKGMLSDKAKGRIYMLVRLLNPSIPIFCLVDKKAESQAHNMGGFFVQEIAVERHKDLDIYKTSLNRRIRLAQERKYKAQPAAPDHVAECRRAMNLIMLDKLGGQTEESLGRQRNRLAAAYMSLGGEEGQELACKVDEAYEILKRALMGVY